MMTTTETPEVAVERVELARMAGKLLGVIDYLRKVCEVRWAEGQAYTGLADKLANAVSVRERLIALSEALPEGPLEAFGREHPLYHDAIDGPYCGYGAKDGEPYTCPVRDLALHWDAWELLGTPLKRPPAAVRAGAGLSNVKGECDGV